MDFWKFWRSTTFQYISAQEEAANGSSLKKSCSQTISQYLQEDTFARVSFNKRLQDGCFLGNVASFLREPILKNICE